jgi:argonaute-like protein implicated in RNA metabolism and viral defense
VENAEKSKHLEPYNGVIMGKREAGEKRKKVIKYLKNKLESAEDMGEKEFSMSSQYKYFDDEEPKAMTKEDIFNSVRPSGEVESENAFLYIEKAIEETHKLYKHLVDELKRRAILRGIATTVEDFDELLNLIIKQP